MIWPDPLGAAFYAAAGLALGVAYFVLLSLTVRLQMSGASVLRAIPLYLARFAGALLVFWFIAQRGAIPLLLALTGFLMARFAVQRWTGSD